MKNKLNQLIKKCRACKKLLLKLFEKGTKKHARIEEYLKKHNIPPNKINQYLWKKVGHLLMYLYERINEEEVIAITIHGYNTMNKKVYLVYTDKHGRIIYHIELDKKGEPPKQPTIGIYYDGEIKYAVEWEEGLPD